MSSAITYSMLCNFREGKGLSDVVSVVSINGRKTTRVPGDFYFFLSRNDSITSSTRP